MKAMNERELDDFIISLNDLKGYELTNFLFDEKKAQLSLSDTGDFRWISGSFRPGNPYIFLGDKKTPLIKGLKKPLANFVKAHFIGQEFLGCQRLEELGRVIEMNFSNQMSLRWTLFPGGQNLTADKEGRQVFAFKPPEETLNVTRENIEFTSRGNDFFKKLWLEGSSQKAQIKKENFGIKDIEKVLAKKKKGLAKMIAKLASLEDKSWLEFGEWLKTQTDVKAVPEEWKNKLDIQRSLSWNMENAFSQHKKQLNKKSGTKERIEALKSEIKEIESNPQSLKKEGPQKSLLGQAKSRGRTLDLGNSCFLYVGKSAKDNLSLLRRAKPWYLWLHIRDYTGAHGIIEAPRKTQASPEQLEKAAQWVVRQSVGEKVRGVFDVIFAECRYVRPIKGAKSGQVTYSHEKVMQVRV